jgi:hypothetical protein
VGYNFTSYRTQVFQVLHLTFFGVIKRRRRYQLPFRDDNATVKCIMKLSYDFRQKMGEPNRWEVFRGLGIDFDVIRWPCRLLFNEEKLRGSAGFREL